jgi:hypothetical protein
MEAAAFGYLREGLNTSFACETVLAKSARKVAGRVATKTAGAIGGQNRGDDAKMRWIAL